MRALADERNVRGFRALIVDDVPEIGSMFRDCISRLRGFQLDVVIETDPVAAMSALRADRFDLVVSDFRMKGADGIDVLAAARARNPAGRRVLMTGYNEIPASIERIKVARVDAYLHKPVQAHELLLFLNDLVRGDAATLARYHEEAAQLEDLALREEQEGATMDIASITPRDPFEIRC